MNDNRASKEPERGGRLTTWLPRSRTRLCASACGRRRTGSLRRRSSVWCSRTTCRSWPPSTAPRYAGTARWRCGADPWRTC